MAESMISAEEIQNIAKSLAIKVHELLRTGSPVYKERGNELLNMTEAELASIIASEPTLIKRPIVKLDNAYLIRPDEERLKELL